MLQNKLRKGGGGGGGGRVNLLCGKLNSHTVVNDDISFSTIHQVTVVYFLVMGPVQVISFFQCRIVDRIFYGCVNKI